MEAEVKQLDVYPEENKCPLCGEQEDIEYFGEKDDAGYTYHCECNKCGATYLECYNLVFAGNYAIRDKDGKTYEDLYT